MRRIFFTVISSIEHALRLTGLDVFTVRDDSGLGLFAFERINHGNGDREYWGVGLHVTVSTLRLR